MIKIKVWFRNHQYPLMQSRIEDEASRRLISNININKSEELIIIDNDIEEITNTMVVASQPGVIAVQPVKSCTRTNHISSSPYKVRSFLNSPLQSFFYS